jgi:hypothetical protein
MPAERPRRGRHEVGETRAAERGHRKFAPPRRFEDIAASIDGPVHVARRTRYTDLDFDLVVVGLELLVAERPVLDGRPARYA